MMKSIIDHVQRKLIDNIQNYYHSDSLKVSNFVLANWYTVFKAETNMNQFLLMTSTS